MTGQAYMLTEDEELWDKALPKQIEDLLERDALAERNVRTRNSTSDKNSKSKGSSDGKREKSRVVTYRVPHNACVQIYDYKLKQGRIVFGPELVMLGPDEQFTLMSLSGSVPKKPNQIQALSLLLGPDFFTDLIVIETADHARLSVRLSYNWHFEIPNRNNQQEAMKLFSVPDFIGDAAKAMASRVRGSVAGTQFDDFHRHSGEIIRMAVFGNNTDRFIFEQNNLVITAIDVQNVEPVDQRTRDALQKSVQLAIEVRKLSLLQTNVKYRISDHDQFTRSSS